MSESEQLSLFGPKLKDGSSFFRKAEQPALGPSFNPQTSSLLGNQLGATMMIDLDRLSLADYRAMRSHPQINASLSLITFMLHQMDWHIECEDKKIADAIEENMRIIWTRLIRAISQSLWAGYSPCALEWANSADGKYVYIDKILDFQPEDCEVNWKMIDSGYKPTRSIGNPSGISPKIPIYDGIKKFGLNYPIPANMSFWYPMLMENGNMYGRKLLRAAFTPWYFSVLIHMYANRYYERFGEPLPIGRAPFDDDFKVKGPDGAELVLTGKQVMEQVMDSIRSRGRVVLPSDRDPTATSSGGRSEYLYDIEYLESQMRGADFERHLSRLDEEMSLAIFTPTLLMRAGDIGSHSLGVQHTQTWLWSLNALAGDIKEYIDHYIVERIKAINFTPNAPRAQWVPRSMGKDNPDIIKAIITSMITAGQVKPDVQEMGVLLGLDLKEIKQVTAPPGQLPGQLPTTDTSGKDIRDRTLRDRTSSDPAQNVGQPKATGKQIAARVGEQIRKCYRETEDLNLSMGFRRRMVESFTAEGWLVEDAQRVTNNLYFNMESFFDNIKGFADEFSDPAELIALVERRLDREIDAVAAQ